MEAEMQPVMVRKFKTLAVICCFFSLAGVIYQLVDLKYIDYKSIAMGFPLGLMFGVLELFLFSKAQQKLRQLSFSWLIIVKAVLYTLIIFLVSAAIGLIVGYSEGKHINDFFDSILDRDQVVVIIYTLVVCTLTVFYLQIERLLGPGVLFKFLKGKYRKPVEEDRIFMFLDLKSSTTIAERLGHKKYYSLLNKFFHEISEPVLMTKAEIYQYVGDEVVFTWETENGLENANCLEIFFMIKKRINEKRSAYMKEFGVVPQFKAGVHYGKVTSAQIGDIKREIIYNGDVLNTTARIQEQCNKVERELLTSGSLLERLDLSYQSEAEKIDTVKLRGKESFVELYSVNFDSRG